MQRYTVRTTSALKDPVYVDADSYHTEPNASLIHFVRTINGTIERVYTIHLNLLTDITHEHVLLSKDHSP